MTVDAGQANLAVSCALVDELARRGVRQAVVCPGSRSTPLAVALAAHPDLRVWVLIDERSAAFFALGMARQAREPVALLSTSGTAAANFLPAAVEASLSRVPLVVLTADRPPELRDWGAAQTIDQIRLYGDHVKWFADLPVPTDDDALVRQARAAAARAALTARMDPAGPVHLNLPFREPLLPAAFAPSQRLDALFAAGKAGVPPIDDPTGTAVPDQATLRALSAIMAAELHGIVVCGPGEAPGLPAAAARFAVAAGYPLLADPLSGLRFGAHDRAGVVDTYDAFLRDPETVARLAPALVIRVGAAPTSKPLQQFLTAHPGRQHMLIDAGPPRDPAHLATDHLRADPAATLSALAACVQSSKGAAPNNWLATWRAADTEAREAIHAALSEQAEPSEARVAAEVGAALPDGATLVAGNSMPVRDIDAFIRGDGRDVRIVGTRGANGIDGVVSTALGAAAVSSGPVVLLVGDLSFFHDMNGLLAARRFGLDATIVVVNNDGGGIFSFLPQAGQLDTACFEQLFGTPLGLDIESIARLYQASYARPADWQAFRHDLCQAIAAPGLSIVEVVTDRARNVAQHRAVWERVAAALRAGEGLPCP